ncbi:MAG: molybdenum cofactor biosynthesis protein MoaE [Phycisphaerae bacterium]|nr:molybdenum cofactor biosynthesis protein MoaE [Phycisphaerae bacterium]
MNLRAEIVDGPLRPMKRSVGEGTGAFVVFEGVVRGLEAGKPIRALEYQVYEPMAKKQLDLLARRILLEYGLLDIAVWHSKGVVGVGEVSFRLVIEGSHRQESLEAVGEFIERMKRDVPIWKRPVFADAKPSSKRGQSAVESDGAGSKSVRKATSKSKRKPKR